MAEITKGPKPRDPTIRVNPTVAKLAEIAREDEIVSLEGYIGPSEPGFVRLYSDLELRGYLEVPERAVRHAEELDKQKGEEGPVRVFVSASTMVRQVRQTVLQAKFYKEGITSHGGAGVVSQSKSLECKILMDILCQLQTVIEHLEAAGHDQFDLYALYQARRRLLDNYASRGCGPNNRIIMDCAGRKEEVLV